jgi:hypothetical protein
MCTIDLLTLVLKMVLVAEIMGRPMVRVVVNDWKEYGKKNSCSSLSHYPHICLELERKSWKITFGFSGKRPRFEIEASRR